jgi:hypothetical protein
VQDESVGTHPRRFSASLRAPLRDKALLLLGIRDAVFLDRFPPLPTAAVMQRRSSQRQLCRGSINEPHRGIENAAAYNAQNGHVHDSKAGDEPEGYRPDEDHENSEGSALNTMRCHYAAAPLLTLQIGPPVGRGADYPWRPCCRLREGSKEAGKLQSQPNGEAGRHESQRGKRTNEYKSATCDF